MSNRKKYQALSRDLADTRKRIDDKSEAFAILSVLTEWIDGKSDEELGYVAPLIVAYYNRVAALSGPEFMKKHPELVKVVKFLNRTTNDLKQLEAEIRREERLMKRPPVQAVVQQGRKCVKCGKRDAKVDDYCKRCARDEGIIVHGKV